MKRLSNEKIMEIISKYQAGITPADISKEYNIYSNSVIRIIRKHGINRNQLERVSQNDIEYIISEYNKGISSEIIANNLGINGSTVCRILKRNNIQIRPAEENKVKYKINQDYFEIIDTESKAYFLGLLYADGNLSKTRNAIKLELKDHDRDILEKFSKAIYGFCKVGKDRRSQSDGTVKEYLYTDIYNKKIYNDLCKLGCTPNKTWTIKFPDNLFSYELLSHFIRGYFDGDGCICIANPNRPIIDFTSNNIFILGLTEYLNSKLNVPINKLGQRHSNTDTRNIQFSGFNTVKIILDYLYHDATLFMNRKYQTYCEFNRLLQNKDLKKDNHISKYGTTYIPLYDDMILSSENLKITDSDIKNNIADYLLKLYREHGFPYIQLTNDELIKDFSVLKNVDVNTVSKDKILTIFNMAGIPSFKHFSPHFFEVKSGIDSRLSMVDTFNDDHLLRKVIMNRLESNFSMTGNMLKQGLSNSSIAFKASIFFPTIAKFIYSKFTKENDIIYDYSMGFGQRLLGALSLPYKVKYIGIDPLLRSVQSNQDIFDFYNKNVPGLNKEAELIHDCSENYCDPNYVGKIDLAFSSPPYYNQEVYENDDSQVYNRTYTSFINEWWRNTIQNISKLLKSDGYFILNIKERVNEFNIAEDMANVAKEAGFVLIDTYFIQLSKNTKFRNKEGIHKFEPIYVFKIS